MKLPLSWLNDFVEIDIDVEELASLMTMLGLEVGEVQLVGLAKPEKERYENKITGLSWDRDKFVVGQVDEVMPHPDADRLVLCRLQDDEREHIVLTGAPNLYPYKGKGPLEKPLKVAYAKQGAYLYDGHKPGKELTKLKRAKIRGVESYSMICSEKELGISDEHEGVIILDEDAPTGMALADYMGDAVFDIDILPNMVRNACVYGVAREIAAATGKPLRKPEYKAPMDGPTIKGNVEIKITKPENNPRFVFGLIRGVEDKPSPYWVQRRLRLAGMRPINSVVDATNYAMLEIGEPLHAFDYDVLVKRAGGKTPTIITRTAEPGEKLMTLDDVERELDDFTTLVADTAGGLAMAGVMGGLESEVTSETKNVLLEGATWNMINVRKTSSSQRLHTEAGYRFARGLHPEVAPWGVRCGLEYMANWSGGQIAADLIDEYPLPYEDPIIEFTSQDVMRHLGVELEAKEIAALLERLEFECTVDGEKIAAKSPPYRVDIGHDVVGKADVMEEIARMYGYDNIKTTRLADALPTQRNNPKHESMERIRDILVALGLQEIICYRMTSREREERILQPAGTPNDLDYVELQNPIAQDRNVMRRSLLAGVLEIVERNIRQVERLALFELGPVFIPSPSQTLPDERIHLAFALTGRRLLSSWSKQETEDMDFFDLKGVLETLFEKHAADLIFENAKGHIYHPGKCARLSLGEQELGLFGELHPSLCESYDLGNSTSPMLVAEFDLTDILTEIVALELVEPVPVYPPVLEDIAVVIDESVAASDIDKAIRAAGGKLLTDVRLFDVFRGEQIGEGKKSLAYSLKYQAPDRTLTDKDVSKVRKRIIRELEEKSGAKLRS